MESSSTREPASHSKRPRLILYSVVALGGLLAGSATLSAAQTTDGVFLPNSTPYSKSYAEWSVAWWQWANSLETTHHPLYDTANASAGQSGSVWYLGGHWVNNGVTSRSAVVPEGTALVFPIMVTLADNTGCPVPSNYSEA